LFDKRFTEPLYTTNQAARYLDLNPATLRYWANKDHLLTVGTPETPRGPCLPFVALVEAQLFILFRELGLSLQAIASGMLVVRKELGSELLKKDCLATDGKDILINYALGSRDAEWTRARDLQIGIPKVIDEGLKLIRWADDDYPQALRLRVYGSTDVIADPRIAYGQAVIEGTRTRVEDVISLFKAREPVKAIAEEFQIDEIAVEDMIRPYVRLAA
jgi:uncharacterized protein (DUF433 family)